MKVKELLEVIEEDTLLCVLVNGKLEYFYKYECGYFLEKDIIYIYPTQDGIGDAVFIKLND